MDMSVSVPLPLLDDIFRLLDYLDDVGDRDDLHFHKTGYSPRFERDNTLWELKLKIKRLQRPIVETYLLTVGDITEDEMHALKEWIADGNSIYDNPYALCDGSGRPMDFINGLRTELDMYWNPSDYFGDAEPERSSDGWNDANPAF